MAVAMMDACAWTVSELAELAGVARSTATEHAHRLVDVGLCVEVRQGRHRYLRLRDGHVAEVLEALGNLAQTRPPRPALRAVTRDAALRAGRTCYRHLAGALGVDITDGLREASVITTDWQLGAAGQDWFGRLGIAVESPARRPLLRACLDWTERRDHLAGYLGDALCTSLIDRGWVISRTDSRAVTLTARGRHGLTESGIAIAA
jgi:hypothetical protein